MSSFQDLLNALRQRAGSDAKAAPLVGIKQSSFSQWRRGHAAPDDEQAVKIAEYLQLDPALVLVLVRIERTRSRKARAAWLRVAERFKDAAAVAALAIGAATLGMPSPAQARLDISSTAAPTQYTLRGKRRGWWRSHLAS